MRELSLFTGAGGGLLGSLILGWRTVAAVENDPYCQRVLCERGGYVADAERQGPSLAGCGDEPEGALGGTVNAGREEDPADVGHAAEHGLQGFCDDAGGGRQGATASPSDWLAEPYVGRVATGVASRVDRLRALGNGQVPQTMAAAFTLLAREAGFQ